MTPATASLSKDRTELVESQLKSGEEILWVGTCINRRGRACNPAGPALTAVLIAGSVVLFGIFLLRTFGLPLLVFCAVVTPILWYRSVPRSRTTYHRKRANYVLTNRRLFTCSRLYRTTKIRTLPLDQLTKVHVVPKSERRLTLLFMSADPGAILPGKPFVGFRLIRDSGQVLSILRGMKPSLVVEHSAYTGKTSIRPKRFRSRSN